MNTPQVHSITQSFWHRQRPVKQRFDRLTTRHTTDVLIMGGGITGLTTAIELAGRGRRVTVCEAEAIASGTTAASTGHLDAHPEMGPKALIKKLGERDARRYTQLRVDAIQTIAGHAGDVCDFERIPAYQYSESVDDCDSLRQQCDAAQQLGLTARWVDDVPIRRAACGYRIDAMGRIDTCKYLDRLTDIATAAGVTIFEKTLVAGPSDDHPKSLKAGQGEVWFDQVVCAVHCNFTGSLKLYAATPPYQSYAIAAHVQNAPPDALYWDHSDPYYYVRHANSQDPQLIIAGGCDHRTGVRAEQSPLDELERWIHDRFGIEGVVARWSGEFFEPVDGLPMIGKAPGKENVWIATGFSGIGLTWGTASASMIADGIDGKPIPLADQFCPDRSGLSNPGSWISEQATTAGNLAKRVLPASQIDPDQIGDGQGAVGNLDGTHVAYCRDEDGCQHKLDPICPHMGGVLQWNEVEQTWDCPVHGGRFSADGRRIYGPPESDMSPV